MDSSAARFIDRAGKTSRLSGRNRHLWRRTKFRTCVEIARGLKTITLFLWYREVDFAGNRLSRFRSLRNSRACAGNLTNNDQAKDPTRGPWGRRHNRAKQNDAEERAGISRWNRKRAFGRPRNFAGRRVES